MADSWYSKVEWDQLRCASGGSSEEVGELLQLVLAGKDVWGNLCQCMLHQNTLVEATIPVAAWMVEALQKERLGNRMTKLRNPATGKKYVVSEMSMALGLLSSMAEVALDIVRSESTSKDAAIAALLLEVLRPGIPLYTARAKDPDDQISKAGSALIEALADGDTSGASNSHYGQRIRAKLGMPLPSPTA